MLHRQQIRVSAVILAAVVSLSTAAANAADWPHWRGLERNGHTAENSGWEAGAWPLPGPAWSTQLGQGCSAPIVVGDRVYALGWADKKDHVHCLEAATGKKLWTVSYPCPQYGRYHKGDEDAYSGPSATPEYDPQTGYLYTLSADGDLNCWDTQDRGRKVWGVNLYTTYGVKQRPEVGRAGTHRDYGYITAPLVRGESLIVAVGAREGNLMAFGKRDGKRQWASECTGPAGHCGGMTPMTVEGIPCLAVLTLRNLVVVRLDEGKEGKTLAQHEWVTDFGNNIASPAVKDNFVLITSEYNRNSICKLEITRAGAKKVWEQRYASKACTPVIHNGHVYWAWQRLYCLDFKTGERKWAGGSFGDPGSCIVTSDGRLIVWGERGKLVLAESADRSPGEYKELARMVRLAGNHAWPHIVLAGGKLYCRDRDGASKCFPIKAAKR